MPQPGPGSPDDPQPGPGSPDDSTACSHGQEIAFSLGDMHFLANSIFIWKTNEYFSTAVYLRTGYYGFDI
jgi:hypothetical protein